MLPQPAPSRRPHVLGRPAPVATRAAVHVRRSSPTAIRCLLHAYEAPSNAPDESVKIVETANATLSRKHLFRDKLNNSRSRCSPTGFASRCCFNQGGIWADTDMVCLKPFDHGGEEIFGWQDHSGSTWPCFGLPGGHPLARWMADRWERPDRMLLTIRGRQDIASSRACGYR